MSPFRRGVDKFQVDVFLRHSGSLREKCLAESDDTLLRSQNTPLDNHKVLSYLTVVREPTHRCDLFLRQVKIRGGILRICSLADTVDLQVGLCSMMVTVLTSTRNRERNSGRMPCSDTSNLKRSQMVKPFPSMTDKNLTAAKRVYQLTLRRPR